MFHNIEKNTPFVSKSTFVLHTDQFYHVIGVSHDEVEVLVVITKYVRSFVAPSYSYLIDDIHCIATVQNLDTL